MTDGTTLLLENASLFSPIAQVHYEFYEKTQPPQLANNNELQCIISRRHTGFGQAQHPGLF